MFIFKLLGFFDLLAGVVIILALGDLPFRLVLGHAMYLMLKAYIFRGDLLSAIDGGIGVYGIISILLPIPFISILTGLFLGLKGAYSLIS